MEGIHDITDLTDICQDYARLGWAVQEQLENLLSDGNLEEGDYNINALARIAEFLDNAEKQGVETGGMADEVALYLKDAGYARR